MLRINLMLPQRMLSALREQAEKQQLSVSEIIRRAVDAYLDSSR